MPNRVSSTGAFSAARSDRARTSRRFAWVDDAVVPQPGAGIKRMRLALEHLQRRAFERLFRGVGPCLARTLHIGTPDLRQNARRLGPAHHRDARRGPGPEEPRVIGPARHAVIARPERAADDHGDLRHRRCRHRRHHLGAVPGDALVLVFAADHEAGDVLQKDQRHLAHRAQLDEMRALLCAFGKQHAVVGDDPDGQAHDMGKAADQRLAEPRLELVEAGAIDNPGDHLADVIGRAQIGGHHVEQFLGIIGWRLGSRRILGVVPRSERPHRASAPMPAHGRHPRPDNRPRRTAGCARRRRPGPRR